MDDSQANNGNTQGEHARRDQIPRRADSVDSRSSRHGFANSLHERRHLGPREQPLPHPPRARVDNGTNIRK